MFVLLHFAPPEVARDFRPAEFHERQSRLDVDIGHLTYERICLEGKVKPRRLVLKQLWGEKLELRHAGLSTPEVKAISKALQVNSRVQDVVMSDCHIDGDALCHIFKSLQHNCFVTYLNVSGSNMDVCSATSCCTMLTNNQWLLALNLSNCSIGDNEVGPIAQGVKENLHLQQLNLSHNKISVSGGLLLGRAFGQNTSLKTVNLSWNHIRAGGAVGLCNSLTNNKSIEELDLSWNGIGFEGCLALGESLRVNKVLKRLNLDNNRINWDCVPYISKSLNVNTSLEILELGQNPISMEGCEDILNAICKSSSKVRYISFAGIPINTKIALLATDIAKLRQFNLIHGGIFSSKDVLGIPRVQQEDPFSLLVRYMSTMGIRVMDLFRIFDKDNKLCVSRERFIQGLKRVRVPLEDDDILTVAKRLQLNRRGNISYQELATLVRNRIRDDRLEDKKQEIIQRKKREERKRILQSDKPLIAPSHFNFMPTLYSMYGARERESERNIFSPSTASFSRPGSIYTPLPPIKRDRNYAADEVALSQKTPKTPETLVHRNVMTQLPKDPSVNSTSMIMGYQGQDSPFFRNINVTTNYCFFLIASLYLHNIYILVYNINQKVSLTFNI
ncbi:hypothetical protein Btru_056810 [Bulinus truncatus]|nr:hypothetical protein Btru_056810 [Bulinus truncatus]